MFCFCLISNAAKCLIFRKPTLNALETAIANVERYYSIIGVVEQFDQFLEALEVVFPDYFRGVTHIYKTAGISITVLYIHKPHPSLTRHHTWVCACVTLHRTLEPGLKLAQRC